MKNKILVLLTAAVLLTAVSLTACGTGTKRTNEYEVNTIDYESYFATDRDVQNKSTDTTAGRSSHAEYVETYFVFAEQGAVVTWFDPQTGEYKYKCKCEECGQVSSSEHTNHRLTVQGASYTSSFTCENSDCIMWGKSQPVKISCNVSGEWVDVYD